MRRKLTSKWIIAALSFIMVFTVLGFCSSVKGLYIAPITNALGISRGAFSISDSCRFIATAVVNLFFGYFMERFGARKLIAAGFLSLIASSLIYSFAQNVYWFYLGGIFLGTGLAWTTTTMVGAIIGRWFQEGKGTIMGAILAANGIGAALAIQILSPIINREGTLFGYRDAYRLVALVLLCVGAVVVLFYKENPSSAVGSKGTSGKKKSGGGWKGLSFQQLKKTPYFYIMLFCVFVTGMILNGITGISAPLYTDVGISAEYIAVLLSVHSIFLSVFKFGIGIFYDKAGLRKTANTCLITAIVVMIVLTFITNSRLGLILAMFYAVFSSLALPLETVMLPIYAGDIFGESSYNKVLGILSAANVAGYAVGSPVVNLCFDMTGSYTLAIYIGCGLLAVATILMQHVISAAGKDRAKMEEKVG